VRAAFCSLEGVLFADTAVTYEANPNCCLQVACLFCAGSAFRTAGGFIGIVLTLMMPY